MSGKGCSIFVHRQRLCLQSILFSYAVAAAMVVAVTDAVAAAMSFS
jgi:hypothetical protein